ncbi:MAG: hypothetical protein EA402_05480 [Planctomycetota bacterium]|nr:MAG: hypothetical protein EA402_05480 [Planctomycetota bacterium]
MHQLLARKSAHADLMALMAQGPGLGKAFGHGPKAAPVGLALPQLAGPQFPSGDDFRFSGSRVLSEMVQERLVSKQAEYRLEIRSPDGRRASLSFDYSSINWERQYTRASVTSASEAMAQGRQQGLRESLAAELVHHRESISASQWQLRIEGDVGLLRDHFAAAPTAQRIFDFATGLGKGMAVDDPRFARFAAEINRGIASGFQQAAAALGSLHEISHHTRSLLDSMLSDFSSHGQRVKAEDYLELLGINK